MGTHQFPLFVDGRSPFLLHGTMDRRYSLLWGTSHTAYGEGKKAKHTITSDEIHVQGRTTYCSFMEYMSPSPNTMKDYSI